MSRNLTFWLTLIVLCGCTARTAQEHGSADHKPSRPNVIFIMADDMGYSDLGCYGNPVATPNIDSLAAGGVRLTNYHTNGAVCSPTRAALMTGRYPQEVGIEGVINAISNRDVGLDPKHRTIAEVFKEAGYRTAMFGKWHLGYKPEFGPPVQGFDEFRGFVSGNVDYQSHIDQAGFEDWWDGGDLKPEEGYLTELITNHGVHFIERTKEQPFFLYLPHGAPHYPYQSPNDPPQRSANAPTPGQDNVNDIPGVYKEMIASLDHNVGRIIACLRRNDLLENTLVVFCSDNGATPRVGSNAPFRGAKGQLYEGGHRVPAIFYWKGTIHPATSDGLAMSMDMLPTLAALAKIHLDNAAELSGRDVSGLITSSTQDGLEDRTVFWRHKNQKAARKGQWKLVTIDGEGALYDLNRDISETTDVKNEHPDIFSELQQALQEWEAGLKEEIKA